MEEHLEDVVPLSHIALAIGLSERQLERLFRQQLRATPVGFYRQLRLERAQRLLTYSRMTIRDVALACGFSSLAEFSRVFKARFGSTPSSLRQAKDKTASSARLPGLYGVDGP
jgi:transcriptional regulator GlxA family with amidase domain